MVRILYYDAAHILRHDFEIEKTFECEDILHKLERTLYLMDKYEMRFTIGSKINDDIDDGYKEYVLTFDTQELELIRHISFVLDIALEYSA